jgi:histidine phosphotransferase ChpT
MPLLLDMRVCGLLTARLCHDLAGPIAAIGNGAELLGDDDPDFAREAAGLIGDSARTAARRLQLFRFVYGFSQGALAGPPPHALATEFFAGSQIACIYPDAMRALPLDAQKLACLLMMIGGENLPRGGTLALAAVPDGLELIGSGEGSGPSPELREALHLATPVEALTARTVGAHFTAKLAESLGWRLTAVSEAGSFRLATEPLASAG